jgi:2-polyprenyl-3-methyl-5-hydroxy-6-metoxy-1,4-benzoquinol methylase
MIFQYRYEFDVKKIQKLVKFKKLKILDFGCGIGNWSTSNINSNTIKQITLYDIDKNLEKFLRNKYLDKKVNINFNYKKIISRKDYNIIIFSSVIQYIPMKKLYKIVGDLVKNKKITIVFIDIPYLPRLLEFFLLPFLNIKRFLFTLRLLFSKKYKQMNYFYYQKKDFLIFKRRFKLKFIRNLHDIKYLRYSLIMQSK